MSTGVGTAAGGAPGPAAGERPGARAWCGVAVMALLYFVLSADVSVLFLAVPEIAADLAPSGAGSLWIIHVGEFVGAATVITFGLLTVRLGRRRLLLAGAALFGIASLLAAYSTSTGMLIGARALLGLAAAAYTPAALSLLRIMFPDPRRFATAFALLLSAFTGGAAAGPLLGGVLLEHFWWGSVFLVNVFPAALLVAVAPLLIRRDPADPSVRIDGPSVGLSVAMVLALVYGLQYLAESGPAPVPVAAALLGATLLAVFVRRQRRIAHPLLDPALFATRRFRVVIVVLAVAVLWANVANLFVAQFLQLVRGLSPLQAGLLMAVPAVAGVLGTLAAPVLQRGAGPIRIITGALALAGVAAGVVAGLLPGAGLLPLTIALALVPVFGSLVMVLTSQLIVTSVPTERAGSATAVEDLVAGASTATGIALLGSMAHAVYRAGLDRVAVPGLAPDDLAAGAQNPGAGAEVASRLGGELGDRFGGAVAGALTEATQSVFVAAAVLSLALAGFVAVALRRPRSA